MIRSIKLWSKVAAFAITIAAALAIAALAMRVSSGRHLASGLAIATSMFAAFFCVFAGIAVNRRRVPRGDPPRMSIKDELDARKLRAEGSRAP